MNPERGDLARLDAEIAALTRQSLQCLTDATKARRRSDWAEAERLLDLSETLSLAADEKQDELDQVIDELVGQSQWRLAAATQRRALRRRRKAQGAAPHDGPPALHPVPS